MKVEKSKTGQTEKQGKCWDKKDRVPNAFYIQLQELSAQQNVRGSKKEAALLGGKRTITRTFCSTTTSRVSGLK